MIPSARRERRGSVAMRIIVVLKRMNPVARSAAPSHAIRRPVGARFRMNSSSC